MKNYKIIAFILVLCFCFSIFSFSKQTASADGLTLAALGAAYISMAESFGLNFTFTDYAISDVQKFSEFKVSQEMHGKSFTELFGDEIIRVNTGKLIIPVTIYGFLKTAIQNLKDGYDIQPGQGEKIISSGTFDGLPITPNGQGGGGPIPGTNYSKVQLLPFGDYGRLKVEMVNEGGQYAYYLYVDGRKSTMGTSSLPSNGFILQKVGGSSYQASILQINTAGDYYALFGSLNFEATTTETGNITAVIYNTYQAPNVDVGYQWEGTIDGTAPDTNLDQLIHDVFDMSHDNNIVVHGEVEPDVPPTPVPTIQPGDIDAYWNRQSEQMEGLGNDIGDISGKLDDLGQQAENITDALEGVNQGIQNQTGVISGALDQAAQDVADAIAEQTQTLDESLTQTAEGVQDIADALQPGEIEPKQFDLRRLFPFCIPFDIHNLLQKFDADPVAPHVQLPFVIQSIGFSYTFDLDFSAFDPVASAMRTVEFIVFALGLAWATSKVIKW